VNLRLFVALEPPEPVRRRLAALGEALRRVAGAHAGDVRWAPPDRVHLTLQFLGAVPEERLGAVREAVAGAAAEAGPLRLTVSGAGGFPTPRRPRVVWAGVGGDVEELLALAAAIGRHLAPLGFPPDGRPLSPHVTLGRSRDARGAPGLGGAIAGTAAAEPIPWRAGEVVLFRSHLGPAGARHEPLARFPLERG
jgi:RNA 2',3'-cyclic 3'-phosphodiesterase